MQKRSMLSQDELMSHPDYLLTTYQQKIYSLLSSYMRENGLMRQKHVAKKLNVSDAYVSQILNGECNFSLKKLILLGLKLGKVPQLEFVTTADYFKKEAEKNVNTKNHLYYSIVAQGLDMSNSFNESNRQFTWQKSTDQYSVKIDG